MAHRIFQLAAGVVLIFATLTPVVNAFDTWDKNQPPANDTELRVTAWFVGAGFVMVMAKMLRYRPALARAERNSNGGAQTPPTLRPIAGERPEPTASPPPIPLRI